MCWKLCGRLLPICFAFPDYSSNLCAVCSPKCAQSSTFQEEGTKLRPDFQHLEQRWLLAILETSPVTLMGCTPECCMRSQQAGEAPLAAFTYRQQISCLLVRTSPFHLSRSVLCKPLYWHVTLGTHHYSNSLGSLLSRINGKWKERDKSCSYSTWSCNSIRPFTLREVRQGWKEMWPSRHFSNMKWGWMWHNLLIQWILYDGWTWF